MGRNAVKAAWKHVLCGLGAAVLAAASASGQAATVLNVTTTAMTIAADGACSLPEAIQAARANATVNECVVGGGAPFTIVLQPGVTYTATTVGNADATFGNSAFHIANNALDIVGNGATITQSGQQMRIFLVDGAIDVTLRNLTITGGAATNTSTPYGGWGGGVLAAFSAVLSLEDVTLSGNAVASDGAAMLVTAGAVGNLHRVTVGANSFADPAGSEIRVDQSSSMNIANSTFDTAGRIFALSSSSTLRGANVTMRSLADVIDQDASSTWAIRNSILGFCGSASFTSVNNTGAFSCGGTISLPTLLALTDNGGLTKTVLVRLPDATQDAATGCTYLSAGTNPLFSNGAPITTDQRGFPRDAHCDIGAVESPSISPAVLPAGTVNTVYSQTVTQVGGTAPVTITVIGGGLAPGLSLGLSGDITGTPTTAGTFPLALSLTDSNGIVAVIRYDLVINKSAQSIAFSAQTPASRTYSPGATFAINPAATATSGLVVTYGSATTAVCTVSGTTVSMIGAGTCTITADQSGNGNYLAAPQATQGVSIGKASQSISFGTQTPASRAYSPGGSFAINPTASATSALAVTYGTATPAVCSVTGTTVTMVGAGTCTITADQSGNGNYLAAPQVTQSVVIGLAAQVITLPFLATVRLTDGPVLVSATGGASGNPVIIGSLTPGVCSAGGVNGATVALWSVGTCTIAANQAGNANYTAANQVTQSFSVTAAYPDAPTGLACVAGLGTATCSFGAPIPNGSPAVSGYELSCRSGILAPVAVNGGGSPLVVTGLTGGVFYFCSVAAKNTLGKGRYSSEVPTRPFSLLADRNNVDVNGDGRGEILLRSAGGSMLGELNADRRIAFKTVADPGAAWRILGTGDFGGVHRSALLMQNIASGEVKYWLDFEGPPDSELSLRTVKPGWVVEAITDIDGDGKADIVWRFFSTPANPSPNPDDNGVVFVWFMNGNQIDSVAARGGAPVSWTLIGAADLHGNGRGDMIWVSPANAIRCITALPNRAFVNELIGTVPAGYTLIRLGDFDGDGKADLLFRNAAGRMKLWRMNGTSLIAEVDLPDTDPAWQVFATGDYNGDGTRDIVFKRADGTLVLWLMNAAAPQSPAVIADAGTAPAGAVVIEP